MREIQSCYQLLRADDILISCISIIQQLSGTLVRGSLLGSGSPESSKKPGMLTWLITPDLESLESITSFLLWLLTFAVCLKLFIGNLTWICRKSIILRYSSPSLWPSGMVFTF